MSTAQALPPIVSKTGSSSAVKIISTRKPTVPAATHFKRSPRGWDRISLRIQDSEPDPDKFDKPRRSTSKTPKTLSEKPVNTGLVATKGSTVCPLSVFDPKITRVPDPDSWAQSLARAIIEVLAGVRAVQQLQRWFSPTLYDAIARRVALAKRISPVPATQTNFHINNSRVSRLNSNVAECLVTVQDGNRARAVALRLEIFRGRWLVRAVEIA